MLPEIKGIWNDLTDFKDSLRARAIKASSWSLIFYSFDLLIRICSSVILTRLLFPEAYGLMSVAGILPTILIMWSDVGLRATIIRNPQGHLAEFLGTAWVIQAVRGLGIWILIILLSFIFKELQYKGIFSPQSIFNDPHIPLLLIITGFSSFLNGIESTKVHLAYRELQLRYITIMEISSRIFSFITMLFMCLFTKSVWVLVIGVLSGDFTKMILSHLILKGPSIMLIWNKEYAKDIFKSGKWIAASSFFSLITLQGDRILLGYFFPASVLGVYALATQIISSFKNILDFNIGNIVPTIFGETFRTLPDQMKDRYYKIRAPLDTITFIIVGILLVAGPSLVSFIYDPRYSSAGWMLQWLSLWLLILPFEIIQHAFPVVGKSHTYAAISVVQAFSLIALSLLGFHFAGLPGMIAGFGCYRFFSALLLIFLAKNMGWIAIHREVNKIHFLLFGLFIGLTISVILKYLRV